MRIVIMGPPGAGKGTQAKLISERLNIAHISTGDIFRRNISEATELGLTVKKYISKGELVPDTLVLNMVKERLEQPDTKGGFVLDGFPRTTAQAKALERFEHIDQAISIVVDDEIVVNRLSGRRYCVCGASFNVNIPSLRPKRDEVCDKCGRKLVQREDDKEETIRNRLIVYHKKSQPLIEFYRKRNILKEVDGTGSVEQVTELIVKALEE